MKKTMKRTKWWLPALILLTAFQLISMAQVVFNDDGSLTERSHKVIAKTPMRRFGDISELNGIVCMLCSDAASFITGTVIPVDGGFSSFSGV